VACRYVLQSSERTLPPFQQLQCIPGAVTRRTITREDAFHAVHAGEFLAVSHRWFEQDKPDAEGHQTTALRTYLADHPEIRWVWYDYWSMPQGKRTEVEAVEFKHMLRNVNLLYLGMRVLILLDLSYMSRFWTQFEAFLSMQQCTCRGLVSASDHERRCIVVPILNANSTLADGLIRIWAGMTPAQAHEILAKQDVTVTNLSDKTTQLGKLLKLHREVDEVMGDDAPPHDDPPAPL